VVLDSTNPKHARALERLETETPIWLTTVDADGQPQSSPVWFWWDGEVFHFWSKPDTPKVRNMRGNPRVSLHLQASDTADDDVVIFEGVAEVDAGPSDAAWFPSFVEKYRSLIEEYGWTVGEGEAAEYSLRFRVTPTRIRVD
jgi:PPOX class probable F420-dependent enzyme